MKLTLLLISTAALAIATPIVPTMVSDLPFIATSTEDPFSNIMMPTIVKDPPPFGTPTEEPLPTDPGEWLQPFYPNPCKEDPDRYFRFCAGVAEHKTWKEKVEM
jgi:hypothetical protein